MAGLPRPRTWAFQHLPGPRPKARAGWQREEKSAATPLPSRPCGEKRHMVSGGQQQRNRDSGSAEVVAKAQTSTAKKMGMLAAPARAATAGRGLRLDQSGIEDPAPRRRPRSRLHVRRYVTAQVGPEVARTRLEILRKIAVVQRDGHPFATNHLHPRRRLGFDNVKKGHSQSFQKWNVGRNVATTIRIISIPVVTRCGTAVSPASGNCARAAPSSCCA